MKNKFDISIVADKRGMWTALLMILTGGVACIFFGLALIGFAITPNLLGNLPSAIATALFFVGSVLLVRRGMRRLKDYLSGKEWAGSTQRRSSTPPTPPAPPQATEEATYGTDGVQSPDASLHGDGHAVVKMKCQSCGAFCEPDGQGRCEYCGMVLK